MHGCGNDYVYIDCFDQTVPQPSELAQKVSDRHFGIGGDGLILIKPHPNADGEMEMYNADGSKSEMCGNGLRCVAKHLRDFHYPSRQQLNIMTGNGLLTADISGKTGLPVSHVTLNMGKPVFEGLKIPTTFNEPSVFNKSIQVMDHTLVFHSVSMGNPHCVIFLNESPDHFPVTEIGPLIENHPFFPNKVNVEFVQVIHSSLIVQRTWERGSGETFACGTGACAVFVAAKKLNLISGETTIQLKGGKLVINENEQGNILLTGPAETVFHGEYKLEK